MHLHAPAALVVDDDEWSKINYWITRANGHLCTVKSQRPTSAIYLWNNHIREICTIDTQGPGIEASFNTLSAVIMDIQLKPGTDGLL